ncbi:MAG: hypothetical protein U5J83_01205 [Bryobacterales bacterium]|nr:hypothetical protein [Bryobacterales bacterium]
MPMLHHTGVTAKEGRQILEASLCGSCHTVLTPTLNERGDIVGEFLEQGPYLEWLASSFAGKKSCQNCHVPQAEGGAGAESLFYIAHNPMGRAFPPTSPRTPFGVHSFAGGNAALLDLLAKQEGAGEGIAVSAGRTRQNLRRAAFLKMEASREADGVALRVTIRNLTGHKLPTGFPSRRMWLRVSAFDGTGRVLFESGGLDGSGQEIASRDARVTAPGLQPHLNVINRPEQVAIYEAEMADESGERTHSLLRASRFHKDNRLLPAGFAPTPERLPEGVRPEWIAPAGTEGDGDFVAGADSVTYRLPGAATRVKADLLFQSIKPSQIRAIRGRGGAVPDALLDGLQGALSVETLAEAELVIGSSGEARR